MAYDSKIEQGLTLYIDAQGDDVPAPSAGKTLVYATEQGLALEKPAAHWFHDAPVIFYIDQQITLTDSYQPIVSFEVPDALDSQFPTVYKVEVAVEAQYSPDEGALPLFVCAFTNGGSASLTQTLYGFGAIGGTFTFWVNADAGDTVEVMIRMQNSADTGYVNYVRGTARRDFRLFL